MLVDAFHAALEDAEIAFDGVGVDVATAILAILVANVFMLSKLGRKGHVPTAFIGKYAGLLVDVVTQDRQDFRLVHLVHDKTKCATAFAVYQRQHFHLVVYTALVGTRLVVLTNVGLIDFDNTTAATHRG